MHSSTDSLCHVLYVSRCVFEQFHIVDLDIMRAALRNNTSLQVTGFLHRHGAFYVQWVEGPEAAIAHIMTHIQADRRHYDVRVLQSAGARDRAFSSWSMGYSAHATGRSAPTYLHLSPYDVPPDDWLGFLQEQAAGQEQERRGAFSAA